MHESSILSVFPAPPSLLTPPAVPVFDACRVGVVLRAVMFVTAVTAVSAAFMSASLLDWLSVLALLTAATLPATLVWLFCACALCRWLARWPLAVQVAVALALGAGAGLYGALMHGWVGGAGLAHGTASACAGVLMAGLLLLALLARARARIPAATQARLGELQARIRPHFLFNTLNSAIALVRAEPDRAEALLEDLSDLFRQALSEHTQAVSLAEEIELARRYLAIESVRFGARLQVQWSLDPLADTARLPPLILQPLLENAVRHGVEPSDSGATIRVTSRRRGARVRLSIENTVPAGPGGPGQGLALANVRERLLLLHDVEASFDARMKADTYRVRLEFPA